MSGLFDDCGPPPTDGPYGERPRVTVPASDPKVHDAARPRLSRQCQEILDRLYRGRVGLRELMGIACNYRARVSDLRAAGYDVRCVVHDYETGYTEYAMFEGGVEVGAQFTN